MLVNIGMAQREEESSETTEKIWIHATSQEIANAQRKNLPNYTSEQNEKRFHLLSVTIALTLI